jgi:hypothetical protein
LDLPKNFTVGDEVQLQFRIYCFKAPEVQALFNKFIEIRKDFAVRNEHINSTPFSTSMQTLEKKFNVYNFVPTYGYYSVGLRENFLQDWQIGWTGGMISTYPLLFAGGQGTRFNVIRNFEWLFSSGISPSGFYWDAGKNGNVWYGGDIRKPHTTQWHLIRKSGDAVFYIIKQFMLMDKMKIPVSPAWKEGNRRVCDAFVRLWKKYCQFGQFVDSQSGEIIVGGSSSGAIVPAALALASQYYHNSEYLEVAKEAAAFYNSNFTQKGITCGGPGDALQNFDSESSYALVESYTTLYELTGDKRWLSSAKNAAKQFASWVVSYDFQFPDTSLFVKTGIHTTGAVYANTQNKHAAPAICTYSGIALLKLFRFTADTFYINLLHDITHNAPQYLPHPSKPLAEAKNGFISERINMTDWEGVDKIGALVPMSTWAETSLMLIAVEIPGVYIQPDRNYFLAFDNIDVSMESNNNNEMLLRLTNTTPEKASVSILTENQDQSNKPLGVNALYNSNRVDLKPGETKLISFKKN